MGGWWRWALIGLDAVESGSVNLPLHHKVQKFSSGTGTTEWSRKKAVKNGCGTKSVVVVLYCDCVRLTCSCDQLTQH